MRYDVVWLEKEALPWLPAWVEIARLQGLPYVVDYDDAWFDRYERQVRQEYAFVSEPDWRAGRARILRVFLDRPRIFLTPEFAPLEAPARANLERSIEALQRAP